jgi:periplasmic mercuric ion binding protein
MRNFLAATLALVMPVTVLADGQQTAVLDVQNMSCSVCPITVKKSLQKVPGVTDAKIDFDRKTATVRFDTGKADVAALVKATSDAGFPSTPRK